MREPVDQHLQEINPQSEEYSLQIHWSAANDIKRVCGGTDSFILKIFRELFTNNYELEEKTLRLLKHPNIVKLYQLPTLPELFPNLIGMNCIVTKEEPYGDMERYIRNNGPLPEMLVQRFTRQVANALQYALDQDIVHPNLALNNLLLGADRNIKLCGWSGSVLLNGKNTEANLVFCIAEIAFCMLTSRPAFFKKNVITDPAFKFLKPDLIHKFWDSREPDIRRKRKEFRFSPPFKAFADAIFLNKITTIKGALEEKWLTTGDDLKAQEVDAQLKSLELGARLAMKKKQIRQYGLHREERILVQEEGLELNSSRSGHKEKDAMLFLADYEQGNIDSSELIVYEEQGCADFIRNEGMKQYEDKLEDSNYFRLFDNRVGLIVAHLKRQFRKEEEEVSPTLFEKCDLKLASFKVDIHERELTIELKFFEMMSNGENQEHDTMEIKVRFQKKGLKLFGSIQLLASDFNEFAQSIVLQELKELMQYYPVQKQTAELHN